MAALAAAAAAVVLVGRDDGTELAAAPGQRTDAQVLSTRPLSARGAERRLEARFGAGARCSARLPRPTHSIRHCRIPGQRAVVVLLDVQGRELLMPPERRLRRIERATKTP